MDKKMWKMFKVTLVMILITSMLVATQSSNVTLANSEPLEQQPIEKITNTIVEEVKENPLQTNAVKNTESTLILLNDLNWSDTASEYTLSPGIVTSANSTGNTLTIHLPKFIEIIKEPSIDNILTSFSSTKKDDGTTEIIMGFADSTGSTGQRGKGIQISQKDFIKYSTTSSYTIEAEFKNDQNIQIKANKIYNVKNDFSKNINVSTNYYHFIVTNPANQDWQLDIKTPFDLTKDDPGSIILDKEMFSEHGGYYKLKADSGYSFNPDGSLTIPINPTNIIAGSRNTNVSVPIIIDQEKTPNSLFKSYKFTIQGSISYQNGKHNSFYIETENNYLEPIKSTSGAAQLSIMEAIQKNHTIDTSTAECLLPRFNFKYSDQFNKEKDYIESLDESFEVRFKMPDYLRWGGQANLYDSTTGLVTLSSDYFISESANPPRIRVIKELPLYIDYDFSSTNNITDVITKDNFVLSEIEYSYQDSNHKKHIFTPTEEYKIYIDFMGLNDKSNPFEYEFGEDGKLIENTRNKKILTGRIFRERKMSNYLAGEKVIDFNESNQYHPNQENNIKLIDYLRIYRIEFHNENIQAMPEANIHFYYKTNHSGDTVIEVKDFQQTITLSSGEYITWIKTTTDTFDNQNAIVISDIFDLYGDVLEVTQEPEKDPGYLDYRYPLSGTVLTEDVTSSYHTYKMDNRLWIKLFPNTKYDASTTSTTPKLFLFENEFDIDVMLKSIKHPIDINEIRLEFNPDLKELKINKIKMTNKLSMISATYTTNLSDLSRTSTNPLEITLADGEYFKTLDVTLDVKQLKNRDGLFSLHGQFADDFIKEPISGKKLFTISESENIASGDIQLGTIDFFRSFEFKQDSYLLTGESADFTGAISVYLGTKNVGDEVSIPFSIYSTAYSYNSDVESSKEERKNRLKWDVINPTYYLSIPSDFGYSDITLKNELLGKTPEIKLFKGNDKNTYIRIRFYGNPDSATGLRIRSGYGYSSHTMNNSLELKLKVDKFAKPGQTNYEFRSFSDLSEGFQSEELLKKGLSGKYYYSTSDYYTLMGKKASFYDSLDQRTLELLETKDYKSRISYSILQSEEVLIDANVNKDNDPVKVKNIKIRSGETFNAFVDLYSGGGKQLEDFVMYVPIPQGETSTSSPTWRAKLLEAGIDASATLDIFVSTAKNPTLNELNSPVIEDPIGVYQPLDPASDLSSVTMIKIKSNTISSGQKISLESKFTNYEPYQLGTPKDTSATVQYAYSTDKVRRKGTIDISATLINTEIKGKVFVDENEDGVMDVSEAPLPGRKVALYNKDNQLLEEVTSNLGGFYHFSVPSISEGDYLKIDSGGGYILTTENKEGVAANSRSYFNKNTGKAIPNLGNSEYLNAGFIFTPEIKILNDPYTVKEKKTTTIEYTIEGATKNVSFISMNPEIATVDERTGVVTGVKEGTTQVRLFYTTDKGTEVDAYATIIVDTNQAPIIEAPATITMNVGDLWDPLDPTIVESLKLTDDHDKVQISDLKVQAVGDEIPVGERFLFIFRTANTDRLLEAGTWKIKYYYVDEDGNQTDKYMTIKVNGQPYLKVNDGKEISEDNKAEIDALYYRVGETLDPFQDVKAYYKKASDSVGTAAYETEIQKDDRTSGIFTVSDPTDSEGNSVAGSPTKAGRYTGTYYIKTPSEAKSVAEVNIPRTLYAQGKITFTGNSLSYPVEGGGHPFATWDAFYEKYKEKLHLVAMLDTPDKAGNLHEKELLSTLEVLNPDGTTLDFSTLDFTLPENVDKKEIAIKLRVKDDGIAYWDLDGASVYGNKTKDLDIIVTVQKVVGEAPQIHFNTIERISTDEIRDVKSSTPNQDLSSEAAMNEAAIQGTHPLRDRLMNDVVFSDDGILEEHNKQIESITRISRNMDGSNQIIDYDPDKETDIKAMMTSIGTYAVKYSVIDSDFNKVSAERIINVAGPTVFTKDMGELQPTQDETIQLIEQNGMYTPNQLYAYHIDSNEKKIQQTTVLSNPMSLDQSKPGTYEIQFTTEHHYKYYPDKTTLRPLDKLTQKVKIHGKVVFNQADNEIIELFVDESGTPLTEVEASYQKAQDVVGDEPAKETLTITSDLGDTISSDIATIKRVTLSADASAQTGIKDHTATLHQAYHFYGLPKVIAPEQIRVKEDITQEELKAKINAVGRIDLPDGSVDDQLVVDYDFTHINESDSYVVVKTSYTLEGQTRNDQKKIILVKVAQPILNANDITYNVGEHVDLLQDSNVTGLFDQVEIDRTKIVFDASIVPMDADGNANAPGTYKVTFTFQDDETLSKVEKDILVKVNGLPEFHNLSDLVKRTGDDLNIWQSVYVTWLKAPDSEGPAVTETFHYANASTKGAKLELRDMKNAIDHSPVDFNALNTPGYYSGEYYAMTPSGGVTTETHTLLLHGKPVIESNPTITISIHQTKPENFLETFKEELNLSAHIMRAYTDDYAREVSLQNIEATQSDLDAIEYGKIGNYQVELSVTDPISVPGSNHNTVTKTIMVNIVDVVGTPPVITEVTPMQRVVDDPIGDNGQDVEHIENYILKHKIKYEKPGNDVSSIHIKSIDKVKGPDTDAFVTLVNPENDQLKAVLNTVGEYQALIEIIDENKNIVNATLTIEVAGKTEFGYDKGGTFVNLGKTLNVRQSDTPYSYDGIYARHMDPNGEYHRVGVNHPSGMEYVNISEVSKISLNITAPHHYIYIDDDKAKPRIEDEYSYHLLVQGKLMFKHVEEINTRVGSVIDPLKTVVVVDQNTNRTEIENVVAVFKAIDSNGTISEKQITPTPTSSVDTSSVGVRKVTLFAMDMDPSTSVGDAPTAVERIINVRSLPNIVYKDAFHIGEKADLNDLRNTAAFEVTYVDVDGTIKQVPEGDITYGYQTVMDNIKQSGAGKSYPLDITVNYFDNYDLNTITKTSQVYVLNEARAIVQIPKYLEMKLDDDGDYSAIANINLYPDPDQDGKTDLDNNTAHVPGIKVTPDTSIELANGTTSFTAFTYKNDKITQYMSKTDPIMKLKYGGITSDFFYLKTKSDQIAKDIGLYQGNLNITVEYEGD